MKRGGEEKVSSPTAKGGLEEGGETSISVVGGTRTERSNPFQKRLPNLPRSSCARKDASKS